MTSNSMCRELRISEMLSATDELEAEPASLCESLDVNEDLCKIVDPKFDEFIEKLNRCGMAFAIRRSHGRCYQYREYYGTPVTFSTVHRIENIIGKEHVIRYK